jgi:hypothetical protein
MHNQYNNERKWPIIDSFNRYCITPREKIDHYVINSREIISSGKFWTTHRNLVKQTAISAAFALAGCAGQQNLQAPGLTYSAFNHPGKTPSTHAILKNKADSAKAKTANVRFTPAGTVVTPPVANSGVDTNQPMPAPQTRGTPKHFSASAPSNEQEAWRILNSVYKSGNPDLIETAADHVDQLDLLSNSPARQLANHNRGYAAALRGDFSKAGQIWRIQAQDPKVSKAIKALSEQRLKELRKALSIALNHS